jgi:hypothetical protein
VSKSAWRSNLTASLSHHCRDRPIADTVRLINMLRCSLSLRQFVHGSAFLLAETSVCGPDLPFAYVEDADAESLGKRSVRCSAAQQTFPNRSFE